MDLGGTPLSLVGYPARAVTNRRFADLPLASLDRLLIPPAMSGLFDEPPGALVPLVEDDNRGAVSGTPIATLDGLAFYLSVKGVGSTVEPFSLTPLDRRSAGAACDHPDTRRRLENPTVPLPAGEAERIITGERWLRGSPYGGQGLEHGSIALRLSERADLTSINGFRIAPVVKLVSFPRSVEERIRSIHWYRRFSGPIVQEVRLIPSNVRVYFHARSTIGNDIRAVLDRFGIREHADCVRFETAFLRTATAMLTAFGRTLRRDEVNGRYWGLDFHDVWLDKDAVIAPDGSVYFVDLEGVEEVSVERGEVAEKIEDQIFRSWYEFLFAYEQIEQERIRRFGEHRSRKAHFETLLGEALRDDPFVRLRSTASDLELEVRNPLADDGLYTRFPVLNR